MGRRNEPLQPVHRGIDVAEGLRWHFKQPLQIQPATPGELHSGYDEGHAEQLPLHPPALLAQPASHVIPGALCAGHRVAVCQHPQACEALPPDEPSAPLRQAGCELRGHRSAALDGDGQRPVGEVMVYQWRLSKVACPLRVPAALADTAVCWLTDLS